MSAHRRDAIYCEMAAQPASEQNEPDSSGPQDVLVGHFVKFLELQLSYQNFQKPLVFCLRYLAKIVLHRKS